MSNVLLSLFCGPGGMDEGFRMAGFRTMVAVDVDEDSVLTFSRNHPSSRAVVADVRDLSVERLDRENGGRLEPVGVIGGPPCQSFSVSNVRQRDDDPRHDLPAAYARILSALNDRSPVSFFVLENVPGLLGRKYAVRYLGFKAMFDRAGFDVFDCLMDAKDYSVPQRRRRLIMVGINRLLHPDAEWTAPPGGGPTPTVRDAIGWLPEPVHFVRGLDPEKFPVHPNHWCANTRSRRVLEAGRLAEGQSFGRSFRTLHWDQPSPTVAYGHREMHVHPGGRRRVSIYEAMLLQSFPRSYRLYGTLSSQVRQVSEAVPPLMAKAIACRIMELLQFRW